MLDKIELFLAHYKEIVTAVLAIVSPVIAASALIFGFRLELEKRRAQDSADRRKQAEAVFGEVFYATSTAKLIAASYQSGGPSTDQLKALQAAFERIMEKLMAQSEVGDRFSDDVQFAHAGAQDRMFVLLSEARLRIAKATVTVQDIILVYLALLTLSYLYQTDKQRQNDDTYLAIDSICRSSPTYTALLIDKDTPSLRKYHG